MRAIVNRTVELTPLKAAATRAIQMAGLMLYDPMAFSGMGYAPTYIGLRYSGTHARSSVKLR